MMLQFWMTGSRLFKCLRELKCPMGIYACQSPPLCYFYSVKNGDADTSGYLFMIMPQYTQVLYLHWMNSCTALHCSKLVSWVVHLCLMLLPFGCKLQVLWSLNGEEANILLSIFAKIFHEEILVVVVDRQGDQLQRYSSNLSFKNQVLFALSPASKCSLWKFFCS